MKTSKQRLAAYRAKAAAYPNHPFNTWKYWTRSIWSVPGYAVGKKGQRFTDSLDQIGKNLGDAHEVNRHIQERGWYTDNFQDETIIGAVCKLHTSKGTYYIPATYSTGWDGTVHYMEDAHVVEKGADESEHEQAIRDVACIANNWAELEAEESREYYAKDAAEQQIVEAKEEIHTLNQKTLMLIREVKIARKEYTPAVCGAITESIQVALRKRKKLFRQIDRLTSNFWLAVE